MFGQLFQMCSTLPGWAESPVLFLQWPSETAAPAECRYPQECILMPYPVLLINSCAAKYLRRFPVTGIHRQWLPVTWRDQPVGRYKVTVPPGVNLSV